jgi:hypothetical protein
MENVAVILRRVHGDFVNLIPIYWLSREGENGREFIGQRHAVVVYWVCLSRSLNHEVTRAKTIQLYYDSRVEHSDEIEYCEDKT